MAVLDLLWRGEFSYPDMVVVASPTDGSCFFHSVLKAFFLPYQTEQSASVRNRMIAQFRQELSRDLVNSYDQLSQSDARNLSKSIPDMQLEEWQKHLADYQGRIREQDLEFICNTIDKDIYILDGNKEARYVLTNPRLLQKDRDSIVLLYTDGHYDLVGLRDVENTIYTLFAHDHDFINYVRSK